MLVYIGEIFYANGSQLHGHTVELTEAAISKSEFIQKKKKNHNCKDVVSLPLNDIERIAELEICIPF